MRVSPYVPILLWYDVRIWPRSKITWSISYSLIYEINLTSCLVLVLCLPIFVTMRGSPRVFLAHLFMSSCNPFTALLSHNKMQVFRKVESIEGSIFWSGLSLLPEVEALAKLYFSSMNVSRACSKSKLSSFVGALRTHVLSLDCFPFSSPIVIPLQTTIFTFRSSSRV